MKYVNMNELITKLSYIKYDKCKLSTIIGIASSISEEIDNEDEFEKELVKWIEENGDEKSSPKN